MLTGTLQLSMFSGLLICSCLIAYRQKTIIAEKNRDIENSLKEIEFFSKEANHRMLNSLQMILSVLNLQIKKTQNSEAQAAIQEGQSRVRSIALVHQKADLLAEDAKIDFNQYLYQLIKPFREQNECITCEIRIEENCRLIVNTAIPVGLIINELVSGSYKHAFEKNQTGIIIISLKRDKNLEFELYVGDTGKGFQGKIDLDPPQSVGLKLIKGLTQQLKGTINHVNENGSHFYIRFKER